MVVKTKELVSVEMRKVYSQTMIEMAKKDQRVVALDCDLASTVSMMDFEKELPGRFINCGIMEGNMAGIAAGMAARGCVPFAHTFACFQSRKCLDQLFLSAGFADLNVKVVGSDPGILALYNGASHMALEDMGIFMNIPNMTLVEPSDSVMLKAVLNQVKDTYGLHYIRMNRKNANTIYDEATVFEIGKGLVLKEGKDITLITSGMMTEETLMAAEILELEGISAKVIDMFTWKPIDAELIISSAKETGAVVTTENHRIATGLGSAVANVLAENCPVPMGRIGIGDTYGEVGTLPYLMEKFHLTKADIIAKVKETIAKK